MHSEGKFLVLNELIMDRGTESQLTALELHVDGQLITIVQADGLIISTPTGSTAYSMSAGKLAIAMSLFLGLQAHCRMAGGPMMSPMTRAFVITPICPHTLSFRPLVLPDSTVISIVVPATARSPATVRFDGRNCQTLHRGDKVVLRASSSCIPTINMRPRQEEWFNSILSKLNWNIRAAQKPMQTSQS